MKSLRLAVAATLIIGGLSVVSFAQSKPKTWQVNKRQQNQQGRIFKGISSGELTKRETYRLEREQAQINRMEDRFRDSGEGLSNRERVRLAKEQNQASRHIYRQKHDKQDRPN